MTSGTLQIFLNRLVQKKCGNIPALEYCTQCTEKGVGEGVELIAA